MSMPSSLLSRCLLAALVLLTLWLGCVGHAWVGDAQDNGLIELSLDAPGDDTTDRDAPISQPSLRYPALLAASYPTDRARVSIPSRSLPPDHPPPELA
ncbi:hypothetical protein [Ferriphaselus sp. R-1]|uniref:hypothetical protein n=1 Tax=Ferriphaselus sp. R-1 TaxID=1485544 RepID=UPI00054ECE4D|nr:hypothetical protein [Ferriphaselus sp. R-1]